MNTKSIRFRLSAWYTVAFAIATVVILTSFYLVTSFTFYRQTDIQLSLHAHKIVQFVTSQDIGMHGMISKESMLQEISDPGMAVTVVDNKGQVLLSSLTSDSDNYVFTQAFREAINPPGETYSNQTIAGSPFRLVVVPIWQHGELAGAAIVGHPIGVIRESLTTLLLASAAAIAVLIILSALGGYILADRGLRPITQISERLKRIGSENLNERVPVPATNDELAELATTFNNLLDRLNQAFERERQFIGDVAHELKTPLATLQTTVEVILSRKRTPTEYRQALSETLLDTEHLAKTLKDILDLAWSESPTNTVGEIFDLSETVEELRDTARKLAFGKKITIKGKTQTEIKMRGKKDKITRALLNIVDNAVKFTKKDGQITLGLVRM